MYFNPQSEPGGNYVCVFVGTGILVKILSVFAPEALAVLGFELSSRCIVVSTARSEAGTCLLSLHLGHTQVQHLYKLL